MIALKRLNPNSSMAVQGTFTQTASATGAVDYFVLPIPQDYVTIAVKPSTGVVVDVEISPNSPAELETSPLWMKILTGVTSAGGGITVPGSFSGLRVNVTTPGSAYVAPAHGGIIINYGGSLSATATLASLGLTVQDYNMNRVRHNTGGYATQASGTDIVIPITDTSVTLQDFLTASFGETYTFTVVDGNIKVEDTRTYDVNSNYALFTPIGTPALFESITGFVEYSTPTNGTAGTEGATVQLAVHSTAYGK